MAPDVPKWRPWAEFGGIWGSDQNSRGELELWAPLFQDPDSVLFTDLRGRLFEENVREGSAALGWRQMMGAGWNWGVWTGVDVRRSAAGNTFGQWSGGLEALAPNWDARVNAYVPFDDRKPVSRAETTSRTTPEVVLTNDQILMLSETVTTVKTVDELALRGFDAEAGLRLFGSDPNALGPRHELRIYGGGFWFEHSDLSGDLTGPMARAEWRVNDALDIAGSRLTIEAAFSYDDVRKDRWEAGARFRIPLGGARPQAPVPAALTPQERRMAERIERRSEVLTRMRVEETRTVDKVEEQVADALTDVRFDRVARVEDGGSVTDTSAEAGPNSLIIAEGGTISGPQELQGNQTLQGGGSTIDVVGVETGTVIPFTAPGAQPTLSNPGNAANLTLLGSNTHVAGFAVQGAGQFSGAASNNGIQIGPDQRNVFIGLSEIFDTGREGINIASRNEVTIYSTGFRNIGDDAIDVNGDDNVVSITDVTTVDTTSEGLDLNGTGNTVRVANMSITNAGDHGIEVGDGNTLGIADTTISNTSEHGIEIGGNNIVSINNTIIERYGGDGIRINGDANTVNIADSTIREGASGDDGIDIDGDNNNVSLTNSTIAGSGSDGLAIDGDGNQVTLTTTSITDSGDDGIDLDGFGNTIDLEDVTIAGVAQAGIDAGSNNTVNIISSSISNAGEFGLLLRSGSTVRLEGSTIDGTGDDAINIEGNLNTLSVVTSTISNAGRDGIEIDGDSNTVTVDASTIVNTGDDGIDSLDGDGNDVTVTGTTITNAGDNGITIGDFNTYAIANTTIMNATRSGIRMDGSNTVSLDDSTLTGIFGENGIHLNGGGNTLTGDGNTAAEATFGGQFCDDGGFAQAGFFSFDDDGTGNPATCPPLVLSDIRLKTGVEKLATLASGLQLYRYRYLWSQTVQVGVMAQEVQAVAPEAVVRGADGYLRVDYARLGLTPMTWEDWTSGPGRGF